MHALDPILIEAEHSLSVELTRADAELVRLARCEGQLKLRLGELLDALFECRGHFELAFSSFEAYVVERCGRSKSWGRATRAFAKRLRERGLARVRRAVCSGQIGWSMAELLSHYATPENEESLLALAATSTVREMHLRLTGRAPAPSTANDLLTASHLANDDERRLLVVSRILTNHIIGRRASDETFVEALLGEGVTTLLAGGEVPNLPVRIELEVAPVLPPETPPPAVPRVLIEVADLGPLPCTPLAIDRELVDRCRELSRRTLQIGRLARRVFEERAWAALGYASEEHYATERVGVSLSSLQHRITLVNRVEALPSLERALDAGRIGYEPALLVSRVVGRNASAELVDAWIARAETRTVKHLREEEGAISIEQMLDPRIPRTPPTDEEMELVFELERKVQSGDLAAPYALTPLLAPQTSVSLGTRSPLRFRISKGLHLHWLDVEEAYRSLGRKDEPFIHFLCRNFCATWWPALGQRDPEKWSHIYARDRHRCTSPVCERRDVTPHHLQFQSHGGTDEASNLTALCKVCHLDTIHEGRMRADGPASFIKWSIGRSPLFVVFGREKIEAKVHPDARATSSDRAHDQAFAGASGEAPG